MRVHPFNNIWISETAVNLTSSVIDNHLLFGVYILSTSYDIGCRQHKHGRSSLLFFKLKDTVDCALNVAKETVCEVDIQHLLTLNDLHYLTLWRLLLKSNRERILLYERFFCGGIPIVVNAMKRQVNSDIREVFLDLIDLEPPFHHIMLHFVKRVAC